MAKSKSTAASKLPSFFQAILGAYRSPSSLEVIETTQESAQAIHQSKILGTWMVEERSRLDKVEAILLEVDWILAVSKTADDDEKAHCKTIANMLLAYQKVIR